MNNQVLNSQLAVNEYEISFDELLNNTGWIKDR